MQRIGDRLVFSASDLNNFLECAHLSGLERRAALGELSRPEPSPSATLVASKGAEHERRYLAQLQERYREGLVAFSDVPAHTIASLHEAEAQTVAAMSSGAEIIYQATFFDGQFLGRADFLRKLPIPSARWPWSYEVIDTKLAHSAKPYFIVQLCSYSEHLARIQGLHPTYASIVAGSGIEQRFLLSDYCAYYRRLKETFLARVASCNGTYPHEVGHCQVCRWDPVCEMQRDRDDYLGLVAGMRRDAIRHLQERGVRTLGALATAADSQRPPRMAADTFERLRAQARLQHVQRSTGESVYELLPAQEGRGFALLPPPDPGDVFFDMEGDPLYTAERGLEYLFGTYLPLDDRYVAHWARSASEEQHAFERLIDLLAERRREHPSMHVYHYAPYETASLKRLAGRYGSREQELDALLRAQVFVDLYPVVRQSLRISQPSYSIKKLEPFYGFTRETVTQRGDDSILMFESWLASGDSSILTDIENYNRDDCISTLRLRDWLIERREECISRDGPIAWKSPPAPRDDTLEEDDDERTTIRRALLAGLESPQSPAAFRTAGHDFRSRWLLGHLLDYHRRDERPRWWAYFARCENADQLIEDREAIGGLRNRRDVAPYKAEPHDRNLVHVYGFPEQAYALAEGDSAYLLDADRPRAAGTIVKIDEDTLRIHLKVAGDVDAQSIDALVPKPVFDTRLLRESLLRVARSYMSGDLERAHPALYDLLLARMPRADWNASSIAGIALSLDRSYLFVQGPPGTGKSTKGAAMIVDLIAAGKRVAIMAGAHKAIHNLLHKVETEARRRGVVFRGIQRSTNASSIYASKLDSPMIVSERKSEALARPHELAAGTAWVFSREELTGRYDYLVIDEAGQVSLANAIACAPCAANVILLGDPLQLAQVSQGAHPIGVEASVLEHLLGNAATVPKGRGIFLDRTYRMEPRICDFISHAVYEGRLKPHESTAAHRIDSPGPSGGGLRYLAVEHEGNSRESVEEARAIVEYVDVLLRGTVRLDESGPRGLTESDILVVAPYNAQRHLLHATLSNAGYANVRVGTVDKFQGQEAPVVIYSMATSSGDEIPRDLGFLFEKQRFNVAISRAQCMSLLVCSPRLLDISCSTPQQMALVNLLCGYVEAASTTLRD